MVNTVALDLASTIRHDGDGGVLDTLTSVDGLSELLASTGLASIGTAALLPRVVEVRAATRALFARAVEPGPPSRADANRLMPLDDAVALINRYAALAPVTPALSWPPTSTMHTVAGVPPDDAVLATLARATIDFLTSPDAADLRACTAPRCVRYFVKGHGRQEFCKPSCSNRARAARHYSRTHAA
ncbi:CGNR zinc finger domain-containing protein [Hamadaea sp. NPDC051192]|uniref:CGNR zinc finger domain-containing protein n=1 Tax=Hamadaea sp. NPDC051192 TaxID=3154940 RepID=UPI0034191DC3